MPEEKIVDAEVVEETGPKAVDTEPKASDAKPADNGTTSPPSPKTDKSSWVHADDYADKVMAKKVEARIDIPDEEDEEKITKEVEQISKEKLDQKINAYDCYMVAKFVIKLIHTLVVEGSRWWAQEKSGNQFRVPEKELQDMSKLLGGIFYRLQVKIGPVAAFGLMALMAFGGSFYQAHQIRTEKKDTKAQKRIAEDKEKAAALKNKRQRGILAMITEKGRTVKQLMAKMPKTRETAIRKALNEMVKAKKIVVDKKNQPHVYRLAKD
ncbi:winged helix-turn-helix transcriptional regulator [Bacteroidales bacterium AH-315-I05]|nr:winged helix-turn-helix transcriptional regulator [Bacteroidales bacterium AH-315-I05]